MRMRNLLISLALSVLILETAINADDPFARATESKPQGADSNSSSGIASMHPAGDSKRGEGLYNASCVVCHGQRAIGNIGPRLAGNPVLSDEQAFWKILSEGRHIMPPLNDALTEQQLADVKAWLKTLP